MKHALEILGELLLFVWIWRTRAYAKALDAQICTILARYGEMRAVEIANALEDEFGPTVAFGETYVALDRLQSARRVKVRTNVHPNENRYTRYYSLTD